MQEISFKKVYFEIIPNLQNIFRNSKNNSYIFFTKILQLIFFFFAFILLYSCSLYRPRETSPWTPWFVFPPKHTKELFKQLKSLKKYNSQMQHVFLNRTLDQKGKETLW